MSAPVPCLHPHRICAADSLRWSCLAHRDISNPFRLLSSMIDVHDFPFMKYVGQAVSSAAPVLPPSPVRRAQKAGGWGILHLLLRAAAFRQSLHPVRETGWAAYISPLRRLSITNICGLSQIRSKSSSVNTYASHPFRGNRERIFWAYNSFCMQLSRSILSGINRQQIPVLLCSIPFFRDNKNEQLKYLFVPVWL